jgi:cell division protein ftsA
MQEQSRYVVGIDVGTKNVRCIVGYVDPTSGIPKVVGVGEAPNSGMRKGVVTNLNGPAEAIDNALDAAERMSGHQVNVATLSINGSHLLSTKADGMITVGTVNNEVTADDVLRLEEVATTGKVPQNRDILEIVAHAYRLDGQDNIKDPVGMTGARLEIRANVVSGLVPHITNLQKSAEMAKVDSASVVPSVLAAAQAVLTENQRENGVAVIDFGASTTGIAVYEEGDLQHLAVIPVGGQNVTNDLAIGLRTDPEVAEVVKLAHARFGGKDLGEVETKVEKQAYKFKQDEIDEIVQARYEEIFEAIAKELKKVGRLGKLPSGIVLVGGAAKVKGLVEFTKDQLNVAARLGQPTGYSGISDEVKGTEFSAAVGLMLIDAMGTPQHIKSSAAARDVTKKASGFLKNIFARFK